MPITALYASLLAPIFIVLAARVIGFRRDRRVAIGDGGDPQLTRAMRVHANFAEYVPFTLLLLALCESLQMPAWLLHLAGIALVVGRALHAYGVSQTTENLRLRVAGMMMTFNVMAGLALLSLIGALQVLF